MLKVGVIFSYYYKIVTFKYLEQELQELSLESELSMDK